MCRFIKRILFLFLIILSVLLTAIFTIENYTTQDSVLAAFPDKIDLLEKQSPPRIIFIGGSNLSFGLDSKRIADTFQIPVINMGLHAGIGFRFMMKSVEPYINKGDIVVLVPEYADYYNKNYFGNIETVAILFDIYPQGFKHISLQQWTHLSLIVLKYAASKITKYHLAIRWNHLKKENPDRRPGIYDKNSFNEYGDAYIHWNKPSKPFMPRPQSAGKETINVTMLYEIKVFTKKMADMGVNYLILPPSIQYASFKNQQCIISHISNELLKNNTSFFKEPIIYTFPDSLFFNSPYHLNKQGIDIRTELIINDIKTAFPNIIH